MNDSDARTDAIDVDERAHPPGQAVFSSVLPEDIDWQPFAAFPPSVRLAVVVDERPKSWQARLLVCCSQPTSDVVIDL